MALAALLAEYGIETLTIEADDSYCSGSRAICISRRSQEIMGWFGADAQLVQKGLGWTAGPEVPMFGFRIALPLDVAVALVVALTTAATQSAALQLLQPQQGSPGRDGNA